MTRRERDRVTRVYFRAMRRWMETRSSVRLAQLWRLVNCLAERLAGHDRPSLFGGI